MQFSDAIDRWFLLGKGLNQRDSAAVRRMVSGFVKLLYPGGDFSKADIAEILTVSLELRRRVKEQLKKIGGDEFKDTDLSYIDIDACEEVFVKTAETCGTESVDIPRILEGICAEEQIRVEAVSEEDLQKLYRPKATVVTEVEQVQVRRERKIETVQEVLEEAEAIAEAEARAKAEAEARIKAQAKAKREADAKAKAEAKAKEEAEAREKIEAEIKAQTEARIRAETKAREEAEARALAETRAKDEAIAKVKAEEKAKAEAESRANAEAKAKDEAEARAKAELLAKAAVAAREKAEVEAREETEAREKVEAEIKAQAEAKKRAETKAKAEAEAKATALRTLLSNPDSSVSKEKLVFSENIKTLDDARELLITLIGDKAIFGEEIYRLANILDLYKRNSEVAAEVIRKLFPPPQMTHDKFMGDLADSNAAFLRLLCKAADIITIAVRRSAKRDEILVKIIDDARSLAELCDDLATVLINKYGDGGEEYESTKEIDVLLSDLQVLIESVKNYS